jgi:hypothetical protein
VGEQARQAAKSENIVTLQAAKCENNVSIKLALFDCCLPILRRQQFLSNHFQSGILRRKSEKEKRKKEKIFPLTPA